MFQDLRYGLRLMIRRPGFAAIAVATLALGIGTTTAIFAVTDHVLLRPVPYAAPGSAGRHLGNLADDSVAGDVCIAAEPLRVAAAVEDVFVDGRIPVARRHDGRRRARTHPRGACHRGSVARPSACSRGWADGFCPRKIAPTAVRSWSSATRCGGGASGRTAASSDTRSRSTACRRRSSA